MVDNPTPQPDRRGPGQLTTHHSTTQGPRPYRLNVPLRWSDMDAYGHVNNVVFLQLLEDARVQGMREWFTGSSPLDTGLLVASHKVEYLRPVEFRYAPVVVDMWIGTVSGGSFSVEYELCEHPLAHAAEPAALDAPVPTEDGLPVALRASTVIVTYDFATARPRRLTADERAVLTWYQDDPVEFRR
ncbi:acyl-CoA thioester hydrolase [Kytococcus aerolatus]|uniref:Acyl-CoA thioester hydrolase n=1 Tax=Kytococcus aerolatus TaxID=592308 RepID=A0A212U0E6_9MICO|nr:thioesterase family protein [Kytococcus aerolatus]SNC71604.1 acyl-CoA thioester hydrolase [Kytococcus aerolatus]